MPIDLFRVWAHCAACDAPLIAGPKVYLGPDGEEAFCEACVEQAKARLAERGEPLDGPDEEG